MNAPELQKELELAAWEMAEAEGYERQAKALRTKAIKRIAAAHCEIEIAIIQAKSKTKKEQTLHEK
jgi:hypothetical protein